MLMVTAINVRIVRSHLLNDTANGCDAAVLNVPEEELMGRSPIGCEPVSLKQLLNALHVLWRRVDARAVTGADGHACSATAGWPKPPYTGFPPSAVVRERLQGQKVRRVRRP